MAKASVQKTKATNKAAAASAPGVSGESPKAEQAVSAAAPGGSSGDDSGGPSGPRTPYVAREWQFPGTLACIQELHWTSEELRDTANELVSYLVPLDGKDRHAPRKLELISTILRDAVLLLRRTERMQEGDDEFPAWIEVESAPETDSAGESSLEPLHRVLGVNDTQDPIGHTAAQASLDLETLELALKHLDQLELAAKVHGLAELLSAAADAEEPLLKHTVAQAIGELNTLARTLDKLDHQSLGYTAQNIVHRLEVSIELERNTQKSGFAAASGDDADETNTVAVKPAADRSDARTWKERVHKALGINDARQPLQHASTEASSEVETLALALANTEHEDMRQKADDIAKHLAANSDLLVAAEVVERTVSDLREIATELERANAYCQAYAAYLVADRLEIALELQQEVGKPVEHEQRGPKGYEGIASDTIAAVRLEHACDALGELIADEVRRSDGGARLDLLADVLRLVWDARHELGLTSGGSLMPEAGANVISSAKPANDVNRGAA